MARRKHRLLWLIIAAGVPLLALLVYGEAVWGW